MEKQRLLYRLLPIILPNYPHMNRSILSIVFAFLAHWAAAQQPLAEVRIDSLPRQGFLLDKGWKFQLGDKPDFAKVDFDDSQWQFINPNVDIAAIAQNRRDILATFTPYFGQFVESTNGDDDSAIRSI
jgi:hypothetical protein